MTRLRLSLAVVFLLITSASQGQVLISLLLGKHLNTGKIEFGLDGGWNLSNLPGTPGGDNYTSEFNLGFYFDIRIKQPKWLFRTGVIVKSTMGNNDMEVYSTGDVALDSLFSTGHIDRHLNYFNVPIQIKYVTPARIFFEGGVMAGLMYKARDDFFATVADEELTYHKDIKDDIHRIDIGAMAGIGYRLLSGNGINIAFRYYRGFADITKDSKDKIFNQSFYICGGIPIGVGKSKAKTEPVE